MHRRDDSTGLAAAKQAQRRALLARRAALPGWLRRIRSGAICGRVRELSAWRRARTIFGYAALGAEVDPAGLLHASLRAGRVVAFPRTLPGGRLEFHRVRALADLAPGLHGIREPGPGRETRVVPGPRDVILVPGVGFTPEGERLGRGGGHYDRALHRRAGAVAIGLGFPGQIVPALPVGPRDARLDALVAGSRTYLCGAVRRQSLRSSASVPPTKN